MEKESKIVLVKVTNKVIEADPAQELILRLAQDIVQLAQTQRRKYGDKDDLLICIEGSADIIATTIRTAPPFLKPGDFE